MVEKGLQTPQDLALGWSVGYYGYIETFAYESNLFFGGGS